jgi:hypothetical protein
MAFWTRKKTATAAAADAAPEVLFLSDPDADEAPAAPSAGKSPEATTPVLRAAPPRLEPTSIEPEGVSLLIEAEPPRASKPSPKARASAPIPASVPLIERAALEEATPLIVDEAEPAPIHLAPSGKHARKKFSFKSLRLSLDSKGKDEPGYLPAWRRGAKGRPTQLFIGFLPDSSKKDAIAYAIGIAQRHGINPTSCGYAVFKHATGWAYEMHEGGPQRAYLPKILKEFDQQSGGPITENSLVTIETAQRRVRIERTQAGLTAFWMPESYSEAQTAWLEPGTKLTPTAPMLFGLVYFGGVIFATGFLALIVTLCIRPDPLPLNAPARTTIAYEALPISQWQALGQVYAEGYMVDSLKWMNHKWIINKSKPGDAAPAVQEAPVAKPAAKASP